MQKEQPQFLPMTRDEMSALGWKQLDILLISGDAYIDHPAFGASLLGRLLLSHGYRVGIIAQPQWKSTDAITGLGRPRLLAGVTAGALDSMLAHYTAFRKKRGDDAYTPGGKSGARPNRACIVYANLVRQAFPGVPVVLGGIEASLRRVTHYDFWSDRLRRSILLDSKADIIVYGMGERAALDVAARLDRGDILADIPGTARVLQRGEALPDRVVSLPAHEDIERDHRLLMKATLAIEQQVHLGTHYAVQSCGGRNIIVAPSAPPLSTEELDAVYRLPFSRMAHPLYKEPIPAMEMIEFSITAHRGCGGGCSFCSLAQHQGRRISSRSRESILEEVRAMTTHPRWTGSVTDVGGPSANMWRASCTAGPGCKCRRSSCLHPSVCRHFKPEQEALTSLLDAVSRIPGVRHLRVASGIRHDLALRSPEFARAIAARYTGGQLKLAPEHACDKVLRLMRKPPFSEFEKFLSIFERESARAGKQQYIVPYLMTAFPGCTDADMRRLVEWLRKRGWKPKQVQCFIPTPGTVATAMYFAGIDSNGDPIPVPKSDADRLRQHHILNGYK